MKKTVRKLALLVAASVLAMSVPVAAAGDTDSLVIAIDADVDTLHPTDYSTTIELHVLDQMYDSLMYYNPDGLHDPEPRIAESYEISDDGLDYTFTIRDDATFHDGSPVTVEDVVFSIELYQASEYQGDHIAMMAGVEAVDDHTVVCHLDSPYAPFLEGILTPKISSKTYYEEDPEGFVTNPIGSGPYKFVSRTTGSSIELEAYEDYYRGEPSIKNITFEVIPDTATSAIALQTGEINFADVDSSVLAQLEANDDIMIQEVETSNFCYVTMNLEQEPFDNELVRQAINYAINRENLVEVCYDGEADVNSNICAKSRSGYSDDQPQYDYDPDKAVELLEEAGIETPYDLGELLVAEKYSNLATVIQEDLRAVGLETTIAMQEFNTYIGNLVDGNYTISVLEMALEGDTQELQMALTTEYIGMANNARYSDPEMDDLFSQTMVENDQEKRLELFDQIFTKAQDEAVYAVICNPLTLYAYNSNLQCPEFPFEGNYYVFDFSWAD